MFHYAEVAVGALSIRGIVDNVTAAFWTIARAIFAIGVP